MTAALPPSRRTSVRPFDDYCYEQTREWWIGQAEIERDGRQRAERQIAQANSTAGWARECALVALRMLKRAGKIKPSTDDERKVIEWAERDPWLHMPGANRRLGSPFPEHYAESADVSAQAVLFVRPAQRNGEPRRAARDARSTSA